MDKVQSLSTGRKLTLAAGLLLLVDTFFAWQKVSVTIAGTELASASANAWHGFWGVLLGLMTIALVAWLAARAFGIELPGNVPDGAATLALGALIAVFAILKALTDDFSAWAAWVGVVLAVLTAVGTWLVCQESRDGLPRTAPSGAR